MSAACRRDATTVVVIRLQVGAPPGVLESSSTAAFSLSVGEPGCYRQRVMESEPASPKNQAAAAESVKSGPDECVHDLMPPPAPQNLFLFACGFEGGLVVVAVGLSWLLKQPLWAELHWNVRDALAGILASLPLVAMFMVTLRSSARPLCEIRLFLEANVAPIFGRWSLAQLAVVSLLAGLGEEILFRSVIQGWLSGHLGMGWGLVVASILFGCAHPLTRAYVVAAGLVGAYLGLLWLVGGNLLIPIVTHGAYDFIALVYFLRVHWPRHRLP